MKRLLGILIIAALLIVLPIAASAETDADPVTSSRVVVVASEDDLPDGYDVDDEFFIRIELKADDNGDWYRNLTQLLSEYAGDEYIYFFVEEEVPEGYTAYYVMDSNEYTTGNVIIVRNVKEGPPPDFQLPETGKSGTMPYVFVSASIFMITAACFIILRTKRKEYETTSA